MLKLIRQLVQKLKKDKKVETQHLSSHSNSNTFVVGSQNSLIKIPNEVREDDYWIFYDSLYGNKSTKKINVMWVNFQYYILLSIKYFTLGVGSATIIKWLYNCLRLLLI